MCVYVCVYLIIVSICVHTNVCTYVICNTHTHTYYCVYAQYACMCNYVSVLKLMLTQQYVYVRTMHIRMYHQWIIQFPIIVLSMLTGGDCTASTAETVYKEER